MPNTPLTSIQFHTVQKCGPSESEVILDWAAESPVLNLLPARKPGWNQYTTQVDVTNLSTFFSDAYIVWLGTAAYSANTVTAGLISNTLNSLPSGSTFWVKY